MEWEKMWVQVKSSSSLIVAEMWKEFFEGEGIPTRLLSNYERETPLYRILIPEEKKHVVEEVLRKA